MEDVLQRIADNLPKVEGAIKQAENGLKVLREVGEPTEKLEDQLRELKVRYAKWAQMLASRGVVVGGEATE